MRTRRTFFLLLSLLAACSHAAIDRPSPTPAGGVRGTVIVQPSCPVDSMRARCQPRPWQGMVEVIGPSGVLVREVRTSDAGVFELPLEPGTYTIAPDVASGQGKIARVTVPNSGYTTVTLYVDIGIR